MYAEHKRHRNKLRTLERPQMRNSARNKHSRQYQSNHAREDMLKSASSIPDIIAPITKFSNIKNFLEGEKYKVSYFYIYLKLLSKESSFNKSDFLNELGLSLANETKEYFKNKPKSERG